MKRDRFRRLAAMMLAAATLWVTAAAMGSDSLRDAAAAVRDSVRLPETLLRWELGDMAAADTLALPALLALRESPLLLSAWADVAALPQDGTATEKTPAAPVPVTPAPQPEADPSGHEDNGAASQTIAPASPSGFVQVGDVFIKNNSTKALEPGWFDGTFAAKLSEDAPQVLIVHTHGSEAYTMPPGEEYEDTGSFRTADASVSVIRVGDELARVLSGYGYRCCTTGRCMTTRSTTGRTTGRRTPSRRIWRNTPASGSFWMCTGTRWRTRPGTSTRW